MDENTDANRSNSLEDPSTGEDNLEPPQQGMQTGTKMAEDRDDEQGRSDPQTHNLDANPRKRKLKSKRIPLPPEPIKKRRKTLGTNERTTRRTSKRITNEDYARSEDRHELTGNSEVSDLASLTIDADLIL